MASNVMQQWKWLSCIFVLNEEEYQVWHSKLLVLVKKPIWIISRVNLSVVSLLLINGHFRHATHNNCCEQVQWQFQCSFSSSGRVFQLLTHCDDFEQRAEKKVKWHTFCFVLLICKWSELIKQREPKKNHQPDCLFCLLAISVYKLD